ncbi:MAG: nucleotidyltransferase domain-containing protein [Deltaproteobacteria bacterium]|nr:MAG: nucleotidyltransferase domain-containing protein [Deltaproteobacteria bacterium]
MIAKIKQGSMGSYPRKRSLDEAGRDSILSLTAGYFASQHPEIIAAYVFGSFARQEAFGDLDVAALIAARLAEPLEFELTLERDLEKLVRIPADVRWGRLEKMDTKVYDKQQTEVSEWKRSHTASTPRNCARRPYDL